MKNVFLIIMMLAAISIIAFWQPSTQSCDSNEPVAPEEVEVSETAIYTDSLIKGLYETFGGMIQVEKKKKELLLSYNPHRPQFHRTPLNHKEFVKMHSDQDHQTDGTDEEVTIYLNTQGDSVVMVPDELLKYIVDRYHIIRR